MENLKETTDKTPIADVIEAWVLGAALADASPEDLELIENLNNLESRGIINRKDWSGNVHTSPVEDSEVVNEQTARFKERTNYQWYLTQLTDDKLADEIYHVSKCVGYWEGKMHEYPDNTAKYAHMAQNWEDARNTLKGVSKELNRRLMVNRRLLSNAPDKITNITLRVKSGLLNSIDARAQIQGISRNAFIAQSLKESTKEKERGEYLENRYLMTSTKDRITYDPKTGKLAFWIPEKDVGEVIRESDRVTMHGNKWMKFFEWNGEDLRDMLIDHTVHRDEHFCEKCIHEANERQKWTNGLLRLPDCDGDAWNPNDDVRSRFDKYKDSYRINEDEQA